MHYGAIDDIPPYANMKQPNINFTGDWLMWNQVEHQVRRDLRCAKIVIGRQKDLVIATIILTAGNRVSSRCKGLNIIVHRRTSESPSIVGSQDVFRKFVTISMNIYIQPEKRKENGCPSVNLWHAVTVAMFSNIIRIESWIRVSSVCVKMQFSTGHWPLNGAWENIVSQRSHGKPYLRT